MSILKQKVSLDESTSHPLRHQVKTSEGIHKVLLNMKTLTDSQTSNLMGKYFFHKGGQNTLLPSLKSLQTLSSEKKKKTTINNTTIKGSHISDDSKGIYWDKETVEKVWEKLKSIRQKVIEKKNADHEKIKKYIQTDQDEAVLNTLLNNEFKQFYRNKDSLYPADVFLELLVEHQKFDILKKVVKDPCYTFNTNLIFKCISHIVNKNIESSEGPSQIGKDVSSAKKFSLSSATINKRKQSTFSNSNNLHKQEIIVNIIKYHLYDEKSEEKVKIIGWIIAQFGLFDVFKILLHDNSNYFESERNQFNNFTTEDDIANYGVDNVQFQHTIENCLKCGFEDLAIFLVEYNSKQKEPGRIPNIAAETESMEFLKYLWEKEDDSFSHRGSKFSKRQSKFYSIKIFNMEAPPFKPKFSINSIIKILIDNDKKSTKKNTSNNNINKILKWDNIDRDKTFIDTLFQYECFEQISTLISIWPGDKFANPDYFKIVILKMQTELILFYLKRRDCRHILIDKTLQEFIVKEYMCKGDLLYYGAEMLTYIYKNQWNSELTKELCKNITKTIKTKDILNCHSSILTCLLIIEFLSQIKSVSLINLNRCDKLISDLKEFCKSIQDCNHQETYIDYLMKQKDTRKRSAFQIVSENSIYSLLETPEIGTIVKKMWNGDLSNNGFLAASSIHRYLFDSDKQVADPFHAFDLLDKTKVYYFQLAVWLDSCSIRYNPIGITSVILVAVYNLFIYLLNDKGDLVDPVPQLSNEAYYLFIFYMILVHMLIFDFFNQLFFSIKSKRPFKIEAWHYIDFLLFIFAWMITIDTKKLSNEYDFGANLSLSIKRYAYSLQLPFLKTLENETTTYSTLFSVLMRVIILSLNDLLVWGRMTGVLLTFKQMGPVMRMIFSMAFLLIRNIIIIAIFLACCAGIFTCLFNRFSEQFVDFSHSVIILFGGFLNDFNATNFNDGYTYFGSVFVMIYVCISAVLMVNLLIAVLANIYEELSKVVDASYRAILIQYYRKFKWDQKFGYLIFLTPPLNIVNVISVILKWILCAEERRFNKYVTRIYFLIFYFPIILGLFIVYTAIILIFAYIKGMIMMFRYQQNLKIYTLFKFLHIIKWFIGGLFYLVYVFIRDIIYCIVNVFFEPERKNDDFQRVRKNISNKDVIIFLKFIHSDIAPENSKDIHTFFMAYLDFEANEKAEMNDQVKKAKEYMKKLGQTRRTFENTKIKSAQIENKTVMLYNNLEEGEHASAIYTKYIRKNLMIIEILENFLIEDDNGGSYVDIDKMRKLLPKTMTVQNYHLRRLIHSDVHALSQAMAELKSSKNTFLQYQLLNKIMGNAQRLDKELDAELFKIQRKKEATERQKNQKASGPRKRKNTEDSLIDEDNKKGIEEVRGYEALISSIRQSITDIINQKKGILPSENSSIGDSMVSMSTNKKMINFSVVSNQSKLKNEINNSAKKENNVN